MKPSSVLRVFLCHSSQDKPFVRDLYKYLKNQHWIMPWLDEENILPGQDWHSEIEKALETSNAVVICLSTKSISKEGYIQRELKFILDIAKEKPEDTIYIIPVRLDECNVPRSLQHWHYVDCFPKNRIQIAYERIVDSLYLRANSLGVITESSLSDALRITNDNFPHQIPIPPRDFIGREGELDEIDEHIKSGNNLCVCFQGMGGIGKTAFALKLSERISQHYVSGQIYVDLLGAADQEPLAPEDVMFHILRAYNPSYQYPEKPSLLHGDYRTVLHGKQALLFLDNARDARQIESLLPPPECGLIITTRQRIILPGVQIMDLEQLPEKSAIELTRRIAGRLSVADAREIAILCGYLPRVIRQAASVLREMPNLTVQEYLMDLRKETTRLTLVKASVSLSYQLLDPQYKKLWRLLALFPREFDLDTTAAFWGLEKNTTLKALGEMIRYSLVGFNRSYYSGKEIVRYWLHDLDRLFADSLLTTQERKEYKLGQIYTLLSKMPGAFMPEKAAGLDAVIQFKFTGEEPGEWYAAIKDGKCEVAKGTHASPKMTLTADSADYVKIFTGEIDGMQAFMQGKLKLAGDLNLAMKLTQMFKIK